MAKQMQHYIEQDTFRPASGEATLLSHHSSLTMGMVGLLERDPMDLVINPQTGKPFSTNMQWKLLEADTGKACANMYTTTNNEDTGIFLGIPTHSNYLNWIVKEIGVKKIFPGAVGHYFHLGSYFQSNDKLVFTPEYITLCSNFIFCNGLKPVHLPFETSFSGKLLAVNPAEVLPIFIKRHYNTMAKAMVDVLMATEKQLGVIGRAFHPGELQIDQAVISQQGKEQAAFTLPFRGPQGGLASLGSRLGILQKETGITFSDFKDYHPNARKLLLGAPGNERKPAYDPSDVLLKKRSAVYNGEKVLLETPQQASSYFMAVHYCKLDWEKGTNKVNKIYEHVTYHEPTAAHALYSLLDSQLAFLHAGSGKSLIHANIHDASGAPLAILSVTDPVVTEQRLTAGHLHLSLGEEFAKELSATMGKMIPATKVAIGTVDNGAFSATPTAISLKQTCKNFCQQYEGWRDTLQIPRLLLSHDPAGQYVLQVSSQPFIQQEGRSLGPLVHHHYRMPDFGTAYRELLEVPPSYFLETNAATPHQIPGKINSITLFADHHHGPLVLRKPVQGALTEGKPAFVLQVATADLTASEKAHITGKGQPVNLVSHYSMELYDHLTLLHNLHLQQASRGATPAINTAARAFRHSPNEGMRR